MRELRAATEQRKHGCVVQLKKQKIYNYPSACIWCPSSPLAKSRVTLNFYGQGNKLMPSMWPQNSHMLYYWEQDRFDLCANVYKSEFVTSSCRLIELLRVCVCACWCTWGRFFGHATVCYLFVHRVDLSFWGIQLFQAVCFSPTFEAVMKTMYGKQPSGLLSPPPPDDILPSFPLSSSCLH